MMFHYNPDVSNWLCFGADAGPVSPLCQVLDSEFEDSDIDFYTESLYPDQLTEASPAQTPTRHRRSLIYSSTQVRINSWPLHYLGNRHRL